MEAKGVPIGKPAEVSLRNNHAQYIFTWYAFIPTCSLVLIVPRLTLSCRYSLSLATAIMLWMVAKKPPSEISRRVRMNKNW